MRAARGLTLIEVLVSLAIVVMVLAVALARVGDASGAAALDAEASRLRSLVALAGERAVLRGTELGLRVTQSGYEFLTRHGDAWEPVTDEDVYRPRRFPADVRARLRVEGLPVALRDAPARRPQIVLWSSGEMTPFEITLADARAGETRRLTGAPDGALASDAGGRARTAAPAAPAR